MAYPESSFFACALAFIQVAGLLSAWLARASEGSCRQAWCQRLFLGCLGLAGGAAMLSVAFGPGYWLTSGMALSVMVLAAVWDFGATTPSVRAGNH